MCLRRRGRGAGRASSRAVGDAGDGEDAVEAVAVAVAVALLAKVPLLWPRWPWAAPALRRLAQRWTAAGVGCDATMEVESKPRKPEGV